MHVDNEDNNDCHNTGTTCSKSTVAMIHHEIVKLRKLNRKLRNNEIQTKTMEKNVNNFNEDQIKFLKRRPKSIRTIQWSNKTLKYVL